VLQQCKIKVLRLCACTKRVSGLIIVVPVWFVICFVCKRKILYFVYCCFHFKNISCFIRRMHFKEHSTRVKLHSLIWVDCSYNCTRWTILIAAVVTHSEHKPFNMHFYLLTWTFHHISILFDNKPFRSVVESNWIQLFNRSGLFYYPAQEVEDAKGFPVFLWFRLCVFSVFLPRTAGAYGRHSPLIILHSLCKNVNLSRHIFNFFGLFCFKRSTWAINCFLYRCLVHSLVICTVLYDLIFHTWNEILDHIY